MIIHRESLQQTVQSGCVWKVITTLGNAMSKDCFSKLLTLFSETATVEYSKAAQISQLFHYK